MTAPSYTTDLATIDLCDSSSTYEEFSGYTLGDGADVETDWYIQGSECASDENNNKTGVGHSIGVDYGSNVSFDTGDCFFAWMYYLIPNAVDTFANGGYRILIGGDTSNFNGWKVGGSDFGRNPYGGWVNVAVDPTYTPDYTVGTPSGNYRHFATAYKCVAGTLKGRPVCADAYRYGRGELKIEYGDVTNGYGTFSGIATQNDNSSNRWGLFQEEGTGYLWKGLLSFGNTTNACDFRDSNVSITVDSTPRTYATFNKIEINNSSSRVDWDGINITALDSSQLSPGSFEVVDDADVNLDNCTFTDMTTFIFKSNSTINTSTFRRCGQVTQGSATFDGCTFDNSTAAVSLLSNNPGNITGCTFNSDGSNHAIEITTPGTYSFTNHTFNGYATSDGSTGNEVIYNNSGGAVTLNASGISGTISVRNGTSASTTVNNGVTLTITVQDEDTNPIQYAQTAIYKTSDRTELMNKDTDSNGVATESFNYPGTPVDIEIRVRKASAGATKYINFSTLGQISSSGYSLLVTLVEDPINNATT